MIWWGARPYFMLTISALFYAFKKTIWIVDNTRFYCDDQSHCIIDCNKSINTTIQHYIYETWQLNGVSNKVSWEFINSVWNGGNFRKIPLDGIYSISYHPGGLVKWGYLISWIVILFWIIWPYEFYHSHNVTFSQWNCIIVLSITQNFYI